MAWIQNEDGELVNLHHAKKVRKKRMGSEAEMVDGSKERVELPIETMKRIVGISSGNTQQRGG